MTLKFISKNYAEFRVNVVNHFYLFFVPFLSYLILFFSFQNEKYRVDSKGEERCAIELRNGEMRGMRRYNRKD